MASDAPVAGYEFGPDATQRATQAALERIETARCVIFVEGITDQIAVETLAVRLGRDLATERVVVLPIGGAHAAKHFSARVARSGVEVRGLVDRAEAAVFTSELAADDVYVCDPDLESELIRAIDPHDLEALLAEHGDLRSFRTMQKQPNWRDRPFAEQMHRWLRSVANRGPRYARALVDAAPEDRLPPPLLAVLADPSDS